MRYIPHTGQDVQRMLQAIDVDEVADLFSTIPQDLKLGRALDLPPALNEPALERLLGEMAASNSASNDKATSFLGAGAYVHHVPAAVSQLLLRGEFFTAYTPYQPEVSQGTLQAIFEYQSMMASILGCDVVNASMYDGASATAEAMLMALRIKRKKPRLLIGRSVNPEVRATCATYLSDMDPGPEEIPFGPAGTTDLDALEKALDNKTGAVVIQQPNALGCIEPLDTIAQQVHGAGALLIVVVLEPVSLGVLEGPASLGADIVTGEGMGLGTGLNFGGPGLGLFGCSSRRAWQMPGRLVGQTTDDRGQTGFVLTMSTREQHIRRARATSNICTNEGLCSLAAAIHLSLLGKSGFQELAQTNASNAHEVLGRLLAGDRVERAFGAPFFNEFTVRVKGSLDQKLQRLAEQGILGGYPLARFYPELSDHLLVYVNELVDGEQVENLVQGLSS